MRRERVHHPELRQRQRNLSVLPVRGHPVPIERQRAPHEALGFAVAALQRLDPPEQRGDPREQVLDADALRQVIVGAEPRSEVRRVGIEWRFVGPAWYRTRMLEVTDV